MSDAAINIQEFTPDQQFQIIHSYGQDGFRIAGQIVTGPQFLFPQSRNSWALKTLADLTPKTLLSALGDMRPEMLLLGLGAHADIPHWLKTLKAPLKIHDITLEIMATPPACRTWNILLSEGRSVAAGLLPLKP